MSMNLPPLPVTLPPHGNSVTPLPPPPWSSSSSSPPPNVPVAHDQIAAATEIHVQMLPLPPSSATGDTVVTVEEEEDEEERRAKEELRLKEEEDEKERRAKEELRLKEEWVKQMRGWLMVLATLAASVTYSAGLNPPGGFWQDDLASPGSSKNHTAGNPVLADKYPNQYIVFYSCNASAFTISIAIIVLLLHQSIFQAEVRLALLKGCMVGGMLTLTLAFVAGSTRSRRVAASLLIFWTLCYLVFGIACWKKRPSRQ